MATFSKTPPKSKTVFRKTEKPLSDQELRSKNQQAANLIAEYNSRIAKGDYMSADDLTAYKNATNEYIGTGNSMIKRLGNQADTANWQQIVADINDRYNTVYNEYSKYASKEDWDNTVAADKAAAAAYQASLDFDVNAGKQRLAALQGVTKDNRYTQYLNDRQLVSAYETDPSAYPYSEQQMKALSNSVMELEDRYGFAPRANIDAEISSLQKQIADAERYQKLEDIESSTKASSNFGTASKYVQRIAPESHGVASENPKDIPTSEEYVNAFYEAVNKAPQAKYRYQNQTAALGGSEEYGIANSSPEAEEMTEDEIAVFNALAATQGDEAAIEYYNLLQTDLSAKRQARNAQKASAFAEEHPFTADFTSILAAPLKGKSYIAQGIDYITTGKVDENAAYNDIPLAVTNIRNVRGENISKAWGKALGENWGKVGNFGYQLGMSMADFLLTAAVSGGNETMSLAIMGTGAAADTTIAAKKRGLNDDQAIALGTVAGAAEVVSEKIGWDALFDSVLLGKSKVTYLLKNAFSEGLEEPTSSVINTLADIIISGDKAELRVEAQKLIDKGMDTDEAWGKVFGNYALSLGVDAIGGMLSGAAMGGGSLAINTIATNYEQKKEYTKLGQKIIDNGDVQSLQDIVASLPANDNTAKLSENVAKKATPAAVGKLYSAVAPKISEQTTADLKAGLQEAGLSNRESSKAAIIFSKAALGQKMTDTEIEIMYGLLKSQKIAAVFENVITNPESVTSKRISNFVAANTKKASEQAAAKETSDAIELAGKMTVTEVGKNATVSVGGEDAVSLNDVDYGGNKQLAMSYYAVTNAAGMTTDAANIILSNPKAITTPGFVQAALTAYSGGRRNVQNIAEKLDASVIDADETSALFEAGREAAKSSTQAAEDNVYNVYQRAKGILQKTGEKPQGKLRIAEGVDVDGFNSKQQYSSMLAAELAPILSVDIVLYNGSDRLTFGYYKASEDAIYLNVNSRWNKNSMMLFTMSHELVHRANLGSPKQYEAFADYLISEYGKAGVPVDTLIRQQMDAAHAAGVELTEDEAFEEVVCDSAQRMLSDTDAGKKLTEWGAKSKENASVVEKFKEMLTALFEKLRAYFKHADSDSDAANAFRKLDKNVQNILADLFVDMSTDAAEKISTIKAAGLLDKINTTGDGGVRYKVLTGVWGVNGTLYNKVVQPGTVAFENLKRNRTKYINHLHAKIFNRKIPVTDIHGEKIYVEFAKHGEMVKKIGVGEPHEALGMLSHTKDNLTRIAILNVKELLQNSTSEPLSNKNLHGWLDKFGWQDRKVMMLYKDVLYPVILHIANAEDGRYLLYEISVLKKEEQGMTRYAKAPTANIARAPTNTNKDRPAVNNSSVLHDESLTQPKAVVNPESSTNTDSNTKRKVSAQPATDSNGNKLSDGQQEYFKYSVVRNASGNLLVMYHGTSRGGFTVFDVFGGNHGLFGTGSYFTESKAIAESYTKKGRGTNPQVYPVYLNIQNPLDMDAAANPEEWQKTFEDVDFPASGTNEDFYRAVEQYYEDEMYSRWEAAESIRESIQFGMKYDGITHMGGGRVNSDGERHRVYIAFTEEQIKSVDNLNPTADPDIHRKISAMASRQLLVDAFEEMIQSEDERKLVDTYRQYLNATEDIEAPLVEVRKQIAEKVKAKAPAAEIAELRKQAATMQAALDANDAALLSMEAAQPLRDLMDRASKSYAKKRENAARQKANERAERLLEKQKDRYDQRLRKQREKYEEKLDAQKHRYQDMRENANIRRKESELRGKISRFKKNLQSTLEGKRGQTFVPARLFEAMLDVWNLIDTDTDLYKKDGSVNKAQQRRNLTKERLENLRKQYAEFEKYSTNGDETNAHPEYYGEYEKDIADYLKYLEDNFSGKSLAEMTLDELELMYYVLKSVHDCLMSANELVGGLAHIETQAVATEVVDEQMEIWKKRKNKKRNLLVKFNDDVVQNLSLSPLRYVEKMAGYNPDSMLVKVMTDIEDGMRKKNRFIMESYKMFELESIEEQNWFEAAQEASGKTYTDLYGEEFKISLMQKMQAVLTYEREQANPNLRHVMGGGFIFADIDLLRKGKTKEALSEKNSHYVKVDENLIASFMQEINSDPNSVAYMNRARKFFNEKAKNAMNEASMATKHRLVATETAYIPEKVDRNALIQEIDAKHDAQKTVNSYGILQSITPGASQAVYITGLNNVIDTHIEEVGTVYGLAAPVRNFNKVMNSKVDNGYKESSVKTVLDLVWGVKAVDLVNQAVQDVQGRRTSNVYPFIADIRGKLISSTFALNLSVVTKQIGSLFSANSELYTFRNPAEMMAHLAYTMAHYDEIAAEIDKYTATAWMRRQGLSDEELHTLITESRKTLAGKYVSKKLGKLHPAKWITAMDSAVAMALWKYCKEDVLSANPDYQDTMNRLGNKLNLTDAEKAELDEVWNAIAHHYDNVVEHTQSMSDSLHRPEIQKRDDAVSLALATFKTDVYQTAGQLTVFVGRAIANPTAGNKRAMGKAIGSAAMSGIWGQLMTVTFSLLRYKMKRYKDDEDKLTAGSFIGRVTWDMLGDVFNYIVPLAGGEIVEIIEAFATGKYSDLFNDIVFSGVNDLLTSLIGITSKLANGKEVTVQQWKKLSGLALSLFGIPASNIIRIWDAIQKYCKDLADGTLDFDQ